ncbi:MAG: hypothetical protein WBB07_17655 [Mycobacterium sp.]
MTTATQQYELVEVLHSQLRAGTLEQRAAAASQLAEIKATEQTEVVVTRYDKFWNRVGVIGDYMELTADIPRNTTPTCDFVVKGGDGISTEGPSAPDPHIPALRKCRKELVPITVEVGPVRWAGFVDHTKYNFKDGRRTLTANCLGIFDILNYIYVLPTWWLPIQVQPISHAVFIGPIVSCIESMIAEQALRLQSGMWEFVNQALSLNPDMRAWFGTLLQHNGNIFQALKTPMYVVRTNILKDTSMLVARTVRMEKVGAVIEDMTKAYGVDVRMDLWMPGDPQPDRWANLQQPTYVVTVKDRLPVTGPTNTIIDSILKTVVDLGGAFFGEIRGVIEQAPGAEGVFISRLAGVDFEQPIAVLVDGPDTPMLEFSIDDYHPRGHTMLLGGRSPTWVNNLINITLSWLIDSLMIFIGITGVPSNLLDGFLNDAFLAFQSIQLYDRRNEVGPYGRPENFLPTAAAPYNIEAIFSFVNHIWDTRGWRAATAKFRNGKPFSLGKHFVPGGMMSIAHRDTPWSEWELYTDYVEHIFIRDNRNERAEITVQIGDAKALEGPLARTQRWATGAMEAVNVLTLAPRTSS